MQLAGRPGLLRPHPPAPPGPPRLLKTVQGMRALSPKKKIGLCNSERSDDGGLHGGCRDGWRILKAIKKIFAGQPAGKSQPGLRHRREVPGHPQDVGPRR